MQEMKFDPWVMQILWRRKWQPTPVFLPGKSHGQRSLVGYSPWGHKESDMIEQLSISLFDKLLQISEDSLSLSHTILSGMSQLDFEDSFSKCLAVLLVLAVNWELHQGFRLGIFVPLQKASPHGQMSFSQRGDVRIVTFLTRQVTSLRDSKQKLPSLNARAFKSQNVISAAFYWPMQSQIQPRFNGRRIRLHVSMKVYNVIMQEGMYDRNQDCGHFLQV